MGVYFHVDLDCFWLMSKVLGEASHRPLQSLLLSFPYTSAFSRLEESKNLFLRHSVTPQML